MGSKEIDLLQMGRGRRDRGRVIKRTKMLCTHDDCNQVLETRTDKFFKQLNKISLGR